MKYNLLIIGKKSFLAKSLKKNISMPHTTISFEDFLNKNKKFLVKFSHIINLTSNLKFISNKYNSKNDHDLIIADRIKKLDLIFILISTRKIYRVKSNIKETDKIDPKCNYSKNKLLAEKKIINILGPKYLILRLSNILGFETIAKRKLHYTFMDIFFESIKKNIIYKNPGIFKDFLSAPMFAKILNKLIRFNSLGIYNVSIGKKVYLDRLANWLNYYNTNKVNKVIFKKKNILDNQDSFFLNNDKLSKEINLRFNLKTLEKECKKISKSIFYEK